LLARLGNCLKTVEDGLNISIGRKIRCWSTGFAYQTR